MRTAATEAAVKQGGLVCANTELFQKNHPAAFPVMKNGWVI